MSRQLVSGARLAAHLGVSRQTLAAAVRRGRVLYADPARKLFDLEEAAATWAATAQRLHVPSSGSHAAERLLEARAIREAAEAELAQLRLRKASGELVLASDVHERGLRWGLHVRHCLEALPPRVGALMRAAKTDGEAEALLAAEIRQFCTDLAAWRPAHAANPSTPDKDTTP